MIGQQVTHPQFGQGQVVAMFRNGAEWLVRFTNGLRLRRASTEFAESNGRSPAPSPLTYNPPPPMPTNQWEARQLIESLRFGIAPMQHVQELTINLKAEQASIAHALNQAHQTGGAVRAIVGEYGYGKSHLIELATQQALEKGFLVATVSLDLQELPPHRGFAIYSHAMRHLRYPDTDERGLRPLMEKTAVSPTASEQLLNLSPAERDPYVVALHALQSTSSSRQQKAWVNWLMGGRRTKIMNKAKPRGIKFPSIYKIGRNARQMAYLLTAVSVLARLNNYSGLCLLIDEAESYSLLHKYQRPKASTFFQAVIYAALREQTHIRAEQFPQHRYCDYPIAYDEGQSLFFMFAVTRSDNRFPLDDWLQEEEVFHLKSEAEPQEVGQFLERILHYHSQAYTYQPDDRHGQVRRGAAEWLAQGIRNGRFSMRTVVRLAVELYDLLYLHPDYSVAVLLDELRQQVK